MDASQEERLERIIKILEYRAEETNRISEEVSKSRKAQAEKMSSMVKWFGTVIAGSLLVLIWAMISDHFDLQAMKEGKADKSHVEAELRGIRIGAERSFSLVDENFKDVSHEIKEMGGADIRKDMRRTSPLSIPRGAYRISDTPIIIGEYVPFENELNGMPIVN